MKSHFLFVLSICPCICILSFFIYSSHLSKPNRLFKVGKEYVLVKQDSPIVSWHETMKKYLKLPLDNHYGSHAIVLLAAAYVCNQGPILELGMGSTSTPLLHKLALDQKRRLVSADSDRQWTNQFLTLFGNKTSHRIKHVEVQSETGFEWSLAGLSDLENWTIVFIDHRPGPRRQFELMLYSQRSDLVVLHDTEQHRMYKYDKGLEEYSFRYRFTKLKTFTDVLSSKNESIVQRIDYLLETTPDSYFVN